MNENKSITEINKTVLNVLLLVQSNPALRTPAQQGHLIITDSLLCPWGKKALKFSLNSTRFIRTP